jgi:hypothetical protein
LCQAQTKQLATLSAKCKALTAALEAQEAAAQAEDAAHAESDKLKRKKLWDTYIRLAVRAAKLRREALGTGEDR